MTRYFCSKCGRKTKHIRKPSITLQSVRNNQKYSLIRARNGMITKVLNIINNAQKEIFEDSKKDKGRFKRHYSYWNDCPIPHSVKRGIKKLRR